MQRAVKRKERQVKVALSRRQAEALSDRAAYWIDIAKSDSASAARFISGARLVDSGDPMKPKTRFKLTADQIDNVSELAFFEREYNYDAEPGYARVVNNTISKLGWVDTKDRHRCAGDKTQQWWRAGRVETNTLTGSQRCAGCHVKLE